MSVALIEASLRHGQQTHLESRLRDRHLLPVATALDGCGFAALDVFGGAVFEVSLRHLAQDPFARLRAVREAAPNSQLLGLVRGQALVGYRQVADDVVDAFVRAAAEAGLDVFRCYDSLNDVRNLERIVAAVRAAGKRAEGALVYTVSPVHSDEGFVDLGVRLAEIGCQALCLYDPAGLLGAGPARRIVAGLRERTGLPVTVHSAALTGQVGLAYHAAVEAGAAALDVALAPLAGGSSLPATEGVIAALTGTDHECAVDPECVAAASGLLADELRLYEHLTDPATWRLDTTVLRTQLPPTAVGHLLRELREQDALDRLPEVQAEIPRVRAELGYPPLITPIAQIVATQAVYNVIDGDRYATVAQEVKDYCLGLYGAPPAPIDPDVRRTVNGRDEPITCRPADLIEPQMEALRREMRREGIPARSDADVVCYALFPEETAALLRGEAVEERLGDEPIEEATAVEEAEVALEVSGDGAAAEGATQAPEAAPPMETRELIVEVDGEEHRVRVTAPAGTFGGGGGATNGVPLQGGRPAITEGTVVAPMQGVILRVPVKVGDRVQIGDVVAVLEAMKMQNDVVATRAGTVREVYVSEGMPVSPRDPIVLIA